MGIDYRQKLIIAYAWGVLPTDWKEAAVGLFRTGSDADSSEWTLVLSSLKQDGEVQRIFPKASGNASLLHIQSEISNEMFEMQSEHPEKQQVIFLFSRDDTMRVMNYENAELRSQEYINEWEKAIFGTEGGKQNA